MQKKNAFLHALISQLSTAAFIASCLLPQQATAGTMGSVTKHPSWAWVGTLSAGPVWQDGGTTQTFYLTPDIEKTYTADKSTSALFDGEVFLGLQKALTNTASTAWAGRGCHQQRHIIRRYLG